jgi:hypothetical protein
MYYATHLPGTWYQVQLTCIPGTGSCASVETSTSKQVVMGLKRGLQYRLNLTNELP